LAVLTPRLLVVHRAVLEAGTLTAAAASLGYTVSAVSQQLATLEREAGQPLWEKVGRGVRPTPAGELLGDLAGPILAGIEDAVARLEDLRSGRSGRLRVVSFHTAGESLLPSAIAALQQSLPGLVVHPLADETEGALRRLRAAEVDAVIVVEPYARNESPNDDLHRTHLLDDEYRILLHTDHPLARRRVVDVAGLADASWVVTSGLAQYVRAATDDVCRRAGFTPRVVAEADEFSLTQGYVAVGLGVALAPLLALGAVRRHIAVRRIRPAPAPRHIWLITRPHLATQPAVRALTAALRKASEDGRGGRHDDS
jgi:DNA-binding transcriptional LysR family regulator